MPRARPTTTGTWRALLVAGALATAAGAAALLGDAQPRYPTTYDPRPALDRLVARSPQTLRVVALSDMQPQIAPDGTRLRWHYAAGIVRDLAARLEPDLVVMHGDLVDAYDAEKRGLERRLPTMWEEWLAFYAPLTGRAPLLPARGNHDVGGGSWEAFFELPAGQRGAGGSERFYQVEVGPLRAIIVDTNKPDELLPGGPQHALLEAALGGLDAHGPPHAIVFGHHPPFTVGASDPEETGARRLHEALMPYADRVRAVVTGHDHLYYRTERDGVPYIVSGGGGWFLTRVDPAKVREHARLDDRVGSFHHALVLDVSTDQVKAMCVRSEGGRVFDDVTLWPRQAAGAR